MRFKAAIVGAAVLGLGLSACGGGASAEEFCKVYNGAKADFEGATDPAAMENAGKAMDDLNKAAPEEIKDDVDYMATTFGELEKSLEDAGLEWKDLGAMQSGQLPEGMDQDQMTEFATDFEAIGKKMNSDEGQKHSDAVTKFANDNCGGS